MGIKRQVKHEETFEKPLVWLHGEVKTPPFTAVGRQEAGMLLRLLQEGGATWDASSRAIAGCRGTMRRFASSGCGA